MIIDKLKELKAKVRFLENKQAECNHKQWTFPEITSETNSDMCEETGKRHERHWSWGSVCKECGKVLYADKREDVILEVGELQATKRLHI